MKTSDADRPIQPSVPPPLTPSILTAPLTPAEARGVKAALEIRVKQLLDMVNVLHEGLARQAYDGAVDIVNASKKIGVGHNDLPPFETFWEARKARDARTVEGTL